ncbi:MAG: hypothetical protein ACI837_000864 [Crocinitomicaceae bacterium]|jgi:hypothetical protein
MNKRILFLAVLLIGALSLSSSAVHAQKPVWQKYSHSESNANINFPDKFEEEVEVKENSSGETYTTTKTSVNYKDGVYFLGITMHASDFVYSDNLEDISIDAFIDGVSGTETTRKVWKRKGRDGIEVHIKTAAAIMIYRILIVDTKQIQVVVARPSDVDAQTKTDAKFLKSFKMK